MTNNENKDNIILDNLKQNAIDTDFEEVESVLYLSAPQLAKKIGTTEATIRTWFDYYGDLIGAKRSNGNTGTKLYKETEVPSYAFIKDLVDNKNMKKDQVRQYISKHGFKYAEYDSGLVDTKDPLGFQALASALTVEVESKLNQFAENLLSQINNQLNNHIKTQSVMNIELKAEIESSVGNIVSEVVADKLNQNKDNIVEDIKYHMDEKEKEYTELDNKRIEDLKHSMENRLKQHQLELQQSKSKGLFGWFKRG